MSRSKILRNTLFQTSYFGVGKSSVIKYYKEFMNKEWWHYERLVDLQKEQLQRLIYFAYEHVPYYRRLFNSIGLKYKDITSLHDLQKIPILTKAIIRRHRAEIVTDNIKTLRYVHGSTGGSTGEPLQYLMSMEDYLRGISLLYRGWGYGGYHLGDRIAIIAGSSLVPTAQSTLRKWAISILRNTQSYSSYGMGDETLMQYLRSLNRFKPEFLRGYPSSICALATFIREKGIPPEFRPRAVFTTSEKLLEGQRRVIKDVFETKVFDNYGLNDGGLSAYECEEHCGMHIDMDRAILEVVDENGEQVVGKPGRIIATSLYNYAFPFIRYETGDIGVITYSKCPCGRESPLLKELIGRQKDILVVNGNRIGAPVLNVLFGKFDIAQYQIVQETDNRLACRIVKGKTYAQKDEEFIRRSLMSYLGRVEVLFEYVPAIAPEEGNKHKFIVDQRGNILKDPKALE